MKIELTAVKREGVSFVYRSKFICIITRNCRKYSIRSGNHSNKLFTAYENSFISNKISSANHKQMALHFPKAPSKNNY